MKPNTTIRIARPTNNLSAIAEMYKKALGFETLAQFEDHNGFDGVVLGHPHQVYHIELTTQRGHSAGNAPSEDNLLVFYIPDEGEWRSCCDQMLKAGFLSVPSCNPYWDVKGRTFEDPDGYRVVLQNAAWNI